MEGLISNQEKNFRGQKLNNKKQGATCYNKSFANSMMVTQNIANHPQGSFLR